MGVLDHRNHKSVVGLYSYAHVDVVEFTNRITHPLGVGSGNLLGGKGSSLDNQVVNRDLCWGGSVELGSKLEEVIN